MGQRMLQHITDADMVVFNRDGGNPPAHPRPQRAQHESAGVPLLRKRRRTSEDYGAGMPPPYDMDAPIVEIEDYQFGIFYLDASENPEEYDGKTVQFKGYIYRGRNIGKDEFVPGRMGAWSAAREGTCASSALSPRRTGCRCPEPKPGRW